MAFLESLLASFDRFLPVLVRVASFFSALPIFVQGVPPLARIALAAVVSWLALPGMPEFALPERVGAYSLLIAEEAVVGLAMALIVQTILAAVYLAGQFIDIPIGFGMVNVIDPQTGTEVPIMAQFKFAVAMLVLLGVNGHHALLIALARSFTVLPVGFAQASGAVAQVGVDAFGQMFLLGLRISLPVAAALFVADVASGIVARAVPQINVFFVGIPLKIGVGLIFLILVLPAYVAVIAGVLGADGEMVRALARLVETLRGSP